MSNDGVPLLALPSGSILQFLLMTLPLLGVYLYFLWLAIDRPNIANPNDPRYADDRIRLMDILYTYLATLILFCSLVVYLLWFVNKRRKLSKRYETQAITILGNVEYDESLYNNAENRHWFKNFLAWLANGFTLRQNYGKVVYDLEKVAHHPACDWEERRKRQLSGIITKKIRVYYRYPREQVSILVLPKYPYSGQPKIDMEADWASFAKTAALTGEEEDLDYYAESSNGGIGGQQVATTPQVLSRDRSLGVILVAVFWIAFLVGASAYVATQIEVVDEYYDDESARVAWIVYWSVLGGGIPVIAFGGNYIRWKIYERWMLQSGTKKRGKKSKKEKEQDAEHDKMQEGSYIQMT